MKRFIMHGCMTLWFLVSIAATGSYAEPHVLNDSELSLVTGQSGVDVSGISVGGVTISLINEDGQADECNDQTSPCEEKDEDQGQMLSLIDMLPVSGWNSGSMLMADPAFINPVTAPVNIAKPLDVIQPITSVVSMMPVQTVTMIGNLTGFSF